MDAGLVFLFEKSHKFKQSLSEFWGNEGDIKTEFLWTLTNALAKR